MNIIIGCDKCDSTMRASKSHKIPVTSIAHEEMRGWEKRHGHDIGPMYTLYLCDTCKENMEIAL